MDSGRWKFVLLIVALGAAALYLSSDGESEPVSEAAVSVASARSSEAGAAPRESERAFERAPPAAPPPAPPPAAVAVAPALPAVSPEPPAALPVEAPPQLMALPSVAPRPHGHDRPHGRAQKEDVRHAIESVKPAMRSCFEKASSKFPGAQSVKLSFSIEGQGISGHFLDGEVADSTITDPFLLGCFLEALNQASFPVPSGGALKVTYPFRYEPGAP